MKIKNIQLNDDTLRALNDLMSMDLNAGAAFKLSRVMKYLSNIIEDRLVAEQRLYDKYGKKDDSNNFITPKDVDGKIIEGSIEITDVDSFRKELNDLMQVENEIPFDKIDFESLDLKTAKINDIIKIEFLFL